MTETYDTEYDHNKAFLTVRTSRNMLESFDRSRIVQSLIKETGIPKEIAEEIALEVEETIKKLKLKFISAPLIREIVNVKLLERKLEDARRDYTRLGLPVYDATQIIEKGVRENANLQHNPETIHKLVADWVMKEYALLKALPLHLADAHMRGEIHIHDLEYFVTRPYCFQHDLRWFLKNGLKVDGTGENTAIAGPAKNAEVAILHAAKALAAAQTNFAGGQGLDFFNVWLAPYMAGKTYKEIKQLAQMFIYEMSVDPETQLIVKRNGRVDKVKIGELVDSWMEKNSDKVVKLGRNDVLCLETDLEVLTCDENGTRFAKVTGMSRHRSDHILEITTQRGIKIKVTEHHSLYVLRDGKLTPVRAGGLRQGDEIVFAFPDVEIDVEFINLYEELKRRDYAKKFRVTNLLNVIEKVGDDNFRRELGIDSWNLNEIISGRRTISFDDFVKIVEKYGLTLDDIKDVMVTSSTYSKKKYYLPMKLEVTPELLRLIGYYLADGYLNRSDENMGVGLALGDYDAVMDAIECVKKVFNAEPYVERARPWNIRFGGLLAVKLFSDILDLGRYDHERKIPAWILLLPKFKLREVLRAYFSGDGYVSHSTSKFIACTTTSEQLKDDITFALLKFEILPTIGKITRGEVVINGRRVRLPKNAYRIRVFEVQKFMNEIGFVTAKKQMVAITMADGGYGLRRKYSKLFTLKIKSIQRKEGEYIVYDIEVEDTHRFIGANRYCAIFSNSQMYVARGGQVVFSDIDIEYGVPKICQDLPAVLPGGIVKDSITYGDFEEEAIMFARALTEVYLEGDYVGKPFFFPKPNYKLRRECFKKEGFDEFMILVHEVVAKFGSPYFLNLLAGYLPDNVFAQCCRLVLSPDNTDWEDFRNGCMRTGSLQVVTVNLPRIAYESNGNDERLFELLEERMKLAREVIEIKREIIIKRMKQGSLPFLTQDVNGEPYYRVDKVVRSIGFVGLNEMLKAHTGEELHESKDAWRFGLEVIKRMMDITMEWSEETGQRWVITQTPAESAAHRLALLDLKEFNGKAVVQGDVKTGAVYYTNSSHVRVSADVPLFERLKIEGAFHPLCNGGMMAHVWIGESSPNPELLWELTKKIATKTLVGYWAYTKDMTFCRNCKNLSGGIRKNCPNCGSSNVEWYSRVTGYYQRVSGWNDGKRRELFDRKRVNLG